MRRLILLKGLNPDAKVLSRLTTKFPRSEILEWSRPHYGSSLSQYAKQLVDEHGIDSSCDILGVSFGGVVAQEIASISCCRHCFVVSSIVNTSELRFPVAGLRFLRPQRIEELLRAIERVIRSRYTRKLRGSHGEWYCWGLSRIASWVPPKSSPDTMTFRIHGDRDMTFPLKSEVDHLLVGAGHLACVTHVDELAELLKACIGKCVEQDAELKSDPRAW